MEAIASVIRSSLVPFLTDKLVDIIDEETIRQYIDEWLTGGTAPVTTPKKRADTKHTKREATKREVTVEPEVSAPLLSRGAYEKMKVAELKAICKERGLAVVGTKATFIDRILGLAEETKKKATIKKKKYVSVPDSDNEEPKATRKTKKDQVSDSDNEEPEPKKKATRKKVVKAVPKVIEISKLDDINIVLDEYGNSIHQETGLAFNLDNEVIGKVDEEGHIMPLNREDLDVCKLYHLSYKLPSDFDFGSDED